jgi:hypothetical protein
MIWNWLLDTTFDSPLADDLVKITISNVQNQISSVHSLGFATNRQEHCINLFLEKAIKLSHEDE